jgi:hypothetical protein
MIMLARNAADHLSTINPGTKAEVHWRSMALITIRNRPNETIISGREKKVITGFTNVLSIPKTKAAITRLCHRSYSTPGTSSTATHTATVVISQRNRNIGTPLENIQLLGRLAALPQGCMSTVMTLRQGAVPSIPVSERRGKNGFVSLP